LHHLQQPFGVAARFFWFSSNSAIGAFTITFSEIGPLPGRRDGDVREDAIR
jgi:hypothetical protein